MHYENVKIVENAQNLKTKKSKSLHWLFRTSMFLFTEVIYYYYYYIMLIFRFYDFILGY